MDPSVRHRQALNRLKSSKAGVQVQFVEEQTILDETTDKITGSTSVSVAGYAAQLDNDPITLREMSLVASDPVTLLFVPDTIGQKPANNSQVTWAGTVRTVRSVTPVRPSGVFIAGKVVAS